MKWSLRKSGNIHVSQVLKVMGVRKGKAFAQKREHPCITSVKSDGCPERHFGRGNGNKFIADDGITSFVSAPVSTTLANGQLNPYVTKSPYSATMANGPSWGPSERFYRVHLKRNQLEEILLDVNLNRLRLGQELVSEYPEDWRLYSIGMAVEIAWTAGDPTSEISVGGSWRYFEAYEAYEE